MAKNNILEGYPDPKNPRVVGPNVRTIKHRIVATERGKDYYDGDRDFGYGGFRHDGRWVPVAKNIMRIHGLGETSAVLQVGCEKAFLLHDLLQLYPKMKVRGTDVADYPLENAMPSVKPFVQKAPFIALPFENREFDFVAAIGVVYTMNITDAIKCLREIQRVGKGKSFVTLAAYKTEDDLRLFRYWTVLGATCLREEEWLEVMKYAGYTGDYKLTTAESLKLVEDTKVLV